jgi:hypothetical protein
MKMIQENELYQIIRNIVISYNRKVDIEVKNIDTKRLGNKIFKVSISRDVKSPSFVYCEYLCFEVYRVSKKIQHIHKLGYYNKKDDLSNDDLILLTKIQQELSNIENII